MITIILECLEPANDVEIQVEPEAIQTVSTIRYNDKNFAFSRMRLGPYQAIFRQVAPAFDIMSHPSAKVVKS